MAIIQGCTKYEQNMYKWLKVGTELGLFSVIILNAHYMANFYPIVLSLGTSIDYYHINMCVQGNLGRCYILRIERAQSLGIIAKFHIFAFFAIFDIVYIFVLRATF